MTRVLQLFCLLAFACSLFSQPLARVQSFGNNPGNLRMYMHVPPGSDAKTKMPLLVVLHGCTQNAGIVAKQSGWNKLADTYGFRVIYPQQKIVNNPMRCFCFYRNKDIEKGKGEDYSIEQMIEDAQRHYNTDSQQVFITGLSAGALMAVSMMADYPQTFNAGAIFAGGAYKTATNLWTAMLTSYGWRIKSPEKWAALVREQNPEYTGAYPRMIIYQGLMDVVVNKNNGAQIMKQWTALHHLSPKPSETIKHFTGAKPVERNVYSNEQGKPAVIYYKIKGLGHALPVDPGKCSNQGGHLTAFSRDINYWSSYWTAVDFGLVHLSAIEGKKEVEKNETGLTFSVPEHTGSKYVWTLPKDCKITGSKTGSAITVNWGGKPGNVDVKEVVSKQCKQPYPTLYVKLK